MLEVDATSVAVPDTGEPTCRSSWTSTMASLASPPSSWPRPTSATSTSKVPTGSTTSTLRLDRGGQGLLPGDRSFEGSGDARPRACWTSDTAGLRGADRGLTNAGHGVPNPGRVGRQGHARPRFKGDTRWKRDQETRIRAEESVFVRLGFGSRPPVPVGRQAPSHTMIAPKTGLTVPSMGYEPSRGWGRRSGTLAALGEPLLIVRLVDALFDLGLGEEERQPAGADRSPR